MDYKAEGKRGVDYDLWDRLSDYSRSDYYPFHMPGHKRRELLDKHMGEKCTEFSRDITEIYGFDNLHHPEGILKESMNWASEVYGSDGTYYLVNGSTCGILSAICGIAGCGQTILIARNCHKSIYNAVILNRLNVRYLYPLYLEEIGIPGAVRPEDVEQALMDCDRDGQKIRAVVIVSPTYEGIVSDVKKIAEIAHKWSIPLIVDEAHGAHFAFGKYRGTQLSSERPSGGLSQAYAQDADRSLFPDPALACGADIVVQSLHKTLPSFTQTAVLHIKSELVNRQNVERYLSIFQSSSPSYLFIAGIERCIRYMDGDGRREMIRYGERLQSLFDSLSSLRALRLLNRSIVSVGYAYDLDMSKLVITTERAEGVNGERLFRVLREKYHLELEMCGPEYVVAMTSLMDTEEGLARLNRALLEIDRDIFCRNTAKTGGQAQDGVKGPKSETDQAAEAEPAALRNGLKWERLAADRLLPGAVLTSAEALDCDGVRAPFTGAEGRISQEFLYLYPPGIPILVPGERITGNVIATVLSYIRMGLPVQGLSDPTLSTILTVAEE